MAAMRILRSTVFVAVLLGVPVAACAAEAIPDLLKGEGMSPAEAREKRQQWYLHFYGTSGWIHGHTSARANKAPFSTTRGLVDTVGSEFL